jgi:hypothetical protein
LTVDRVSRYIPLSIPRLSKLKEKGEKLIKQMIKAGELIKNDYMNLSGESITIYTFNVYDGVRQDESHKWPNITVIKRNEKAAKALGGIYEVQIDDTQKIHSFKNVL